VCCCRHLLPICSGSVVVSVEITGSVEVTLADCWGSIPFRVGTIPVSTSDTLTHWYHSDYSEADSHYSDGGGETCSCCRPPSIVAGSLSELYLEKICDSSHWWRWLLMFDSCHSFGDIPLIVASELIFSAISVMKQKCHPLQWYIPTLHFCMWETVWYAERGMQRKQRNKCAWQSRCGSLSIWHRGMTRRR